MQTGAAEMPLRSRAPIRAHVSCDSSCVNRVRASSASTTTRRSPPSLLMSRMQDPLNTNCVHSSIRLPFVALCFMSILGGQYSTAGTVALSNTRGRIRMGITSGAPQKHSSLDMPRLRGGGDMGYDWTLSTQFSHDGHIHQIEYALEAVKKGLTVVAIKGEHCLAIAVERRATAKLQIPSTIRKIYQIDAHVVGVGAGLSADMRVLVDKVRVEALSYRMSFEDCPTVEYLSRFTGDAMLGATTDPNSRPFGCSMLITGMDLLANSTGRPVVKPYPVPRIFLCEPSGNIREWKGVAMGRNAETVNEYLEKNYDVNFRYLEGKEKQVEERILCEFVLAAMMEVTPVNANTVEVATMNAERGVRLLQDQELDLMVENLLKQNAELKEKATSEAFQEKLRELEVEKTEAFHPQAAD